MVLENLLLGTLQDAWFQVSAAEYMRSSLFWDFTQRKFTVADVSEIPIDNYQTTLLNIQTLQDAYSYVYPASDLFNSG
jgi:hypothetical protein